ncbi:uncharacterized protein [Trachinotus anak]|uniref:uncharacterized protein n=1 Tax=Trachinotus anak TaxID=443729 RepID=UPI0039F1EA80
MVYIVVYEMMRKSSCLSKRDSTEVAKKMVAKYPKSLQDIIEGDVIGPGYHSLVKHLQNRVENVRQSTTPKIRKRKHCTDESDTDEVPPEQRAAIQDTYGCINWDLKVLPLGETPESQEEKKEKLKMMNQQTEANPEEVKLLMKLTFYTQHVKEMVLLLLSYFDEKEEAMFCYVEDTCLAGEVQMDQVHLTPTIVVCGKLTFLSWSFFHSLCISLFLFFLSSVYLDTIQVVECFLLLYALEVISLPTCKYTFLCFDVRQ